MEDAGVRHHCRITTIVVAFIWDCDCVSISGRQFNINNQVTLHPSSYRGRPVTEANVQDYISSIVSKYLPPEQPPWHICIVPLAIAPSATTRAEEAATADVDVDVAVNTDIDTEDIPPESSVSTKVGLWRNYFLFVTRIYMPYTHEHTNNLSENNGVDRTNMCQTHTHTHISFV